jgi:hypothetical protein
MPWSCHCLCQELKGHPMRGDHSLALLGLVASGLGMVSMSRKTSFRSAGEQMTYMARKQSRVESGGQAEVEVRRTHVCRDAHKHPRKRDLCPFVLQCGSQHVTLTPGARFPTQGQTCSSCCPICSHR